MAMYYIEKKVIKDRNYQRPYFLYDRARDGFKALLAALKFKRGEKVLLPAYIGWSSGEGSGVFDPIKELGLPYEFYRLDDRLHIDLENLKKIFRVTKVKIFVMIHYFGYLDPNYEKAVSMAKENGALVLEDEAHAMLTDLVGGISGRKGDFCIYSLHKLLPVSKGGMLILNRIDNPIYKRIRSFSKDISLPWQFDLKKISERRRKNAELILGLLARLKREIEPLYSEIKEGEVPQTLPVMIRRVSRDKLYFMMNEAGYGVVSLYHTLIKPITLEKYPLAHQISRGIFNLPVHQDAERKLLEGMINKLAECIKLLLN